MGDQVLAALSQYGSPVLFAAVMVAAIGVPLPVTLLLVVTGSLISQGVMKFWWAIGVASAGSIVGDQIGYAIGRWGGTRLISKCIALLGGRERLAQAEAKARRWGGWGVFFSRWLVSPLGPWINFASGIAEYSWVRFVIWDVLGEVLGVVIFIALGRTFSDRILALDAVLGDFTWAFVALLAALVLGWKIWTAIRNRRTVQ
jgi:membrane protein DedA with SNARE-associated domain